MMFMITETKGASCDIHTSRECVFRQSREEDGAASDTKAPHEHVTADHAARGEILPGMQG